MLRNNYLIINRKAQIFHEMKMADNTAIFVDVEGNVLDYGTVIVDESVYVALYCDEVQNVTLVIDKHNHQDVVTILWCSESEYNKFKQSIQCCLNTKLSRQNIKLNRYAEDIASKLANGVKLSVVDAPIDSDMVECPECGMMSPKGTIYCMDCGAEL